MSITPREPLTPTARIAIALEVFLAIGALGGGARCCWDPVARSFRSGVGARRLALRRLFRAGRDPVHRHRPRTTGRCGPDLARHRLAPLLACATGGALIIWLAVEIAIVGYSNKPPLQALYLALGVVIVLVGVRWLRQTRSPSPGPA